jgi:hypothetical protein
VHLFSRRHEHASLGDVLWRNRIEAGSTKARRVIIPSQRRRRQYLEKDLGIGWARRGWLEAAGVLNTRHWPQMKKLLKRICLFIPSEQVGFYGSKI